MISLYKRIAVLVLVTASFMFVVAWRSAQIPASTSPQAVTTYHHDNLRTGWNSNETVLTPANVNGTSFGLLHSVTLDQQVDAQPLIVPGETITAGQHQGKHDVVYIETENNTIYSIDASSGLVLLTRNLGPAVPKPENCGNNSSVVGINGTPVIDQAANVMYVIVYTLGNPNTGFSPPAPTYTIRELDLGDFKDKLAPVVVAASHKLDNGSTYKFDATRQRQRPGLLDANGNIYAGFGSFCDFNTKSTRGWVLGWQKGSLTQLADNKLTDTQVEPPPAPLPTPTPCPIVSHTPPESCYFLSSVWMSGYGLSSDASGNVYFVTGNSDKYHDTYDGVTDVQESVVKLTSSLTMSDIFTPSDHFALDKGDQDYGSGGVLLLPPQAGPIPHLAAAAGKEGNLFLLNQADLGGSSSTDAGIVGVVPIGKCWCGQSYFSNGTPHVVSSGGTSVILWKLETSPSDKLVSEGSLTITSGQDGGFFTSVSSSGSSNAIIWAVSRPTFAKLPNGTRDTRVFLHAINAQPSNGTLPLLVRQAAGTWTHSGGNANIVPVVANGHVYVASDSRLSIFGLLPAGAVSETITPDPPAQNAFVDTTQHEIFGAISSINGSQFTLQTRTGSLITVDASVAIQNDLSNGVEVGGAVDVQGTIDSSGVLLANSIQRAKDSPDLWPNDI